MLSEPGCTSAEHILKGLIPGDIAVKFAGKGLAEGSSVQIPAGIVTRRIDWLCTVGAVAGSSCRSKVKFNTDTGEILPGLCSNHLNKITHPLPALLHMQAPIRIMPVYSNRQFGACFPRPTLPAVAAVTIMGPVGHIIEHAF